MDFSVLSLQLPISLSTFQNKELEKKRKKKTTDTNNNMNKPKRPHGKWKKPEKRDMYYTVPFIKNF